MKQELQNPSSSRQINSPTLKRNNMKIQSAETLLKIQVILCYKLKNAVPPTLIAYIQCTNNKIVYLHKFMLQSDNCSSYVTNRILWNF